MGTAFLPETPASQGTQPKLAPICCTGLALPHIDTPTGVSREDEDVLVKH